MHQAKNYLQKVFQFFLFQKNEIRYEIGQHSTQLQNIHRSDFFFKKIKLKMFITCRCNSHTKQVSQLYMCYFVHWELLVDLSQASAIHHVRSLKHIHKIYFEATGRKKSWILVFCIYLDFLEEEWMRTLRSKGLRDWNVFFFIKWVPLWTYD